MTKRFIITNDDSAAGHLKGAHRDAVVIPLVRPFISGRLFTDAELAAFFAPRRKTKTKAQFHWLDCKPVWRNYKAAEKPVRGLVEICAWADTVELWIDPRPDDQVQLIGLLHYLRAYPEIAAKLTFVQSYVRMGGHLAEVHAQWKLPAVKISEDHFELASRAWRAFGAATPEDWFGLLATDLSLLPRLRNAVIQLLEELPWRATGMGATEMRMLDFISGTKTTPPDVFRSEHGESCRVFGFWELGELLDGLGRCRTPAIVGFEEGPFSFEMQNDRIRRQRYNNSKLSLTPLGLAIITHTDDFARHNTIRRWWGGTKLTNKNLWRWDQDNQVLVAP
jgi:hypothetical protein